MQLEDQALAVDGCAHRHRLGDQWSAMAAITKYAVSSIAGAKRSAGTDDAAIPGADRQAFDRGGEPGIAEGDGYRP